MVDAQFKLSISAIDDVAPNGQDDISFLFSTKPKICRCNP